MGNEEIGEDSKKETDEQEAMSKQLRDMAKEMEGDTSKQETELKTGGEGVRKEIKRPKMFRRGFHRPA